MTDEQWFALLPHLLKETAGREYPVFLVKIYRMFGIQSTDIADLANRLKKDGRVGFRVSVVVSGTWEPLDVVFYRMPANSER